MVLSKNDIGTYFTLLERNIENYFLNLLHNFWAALCNRW